MSIQLLYHMTESYVFACMFSYIRMCGNCIYIYNIACVLGVRVQQYFERNPKVNWDQLMIEWQKASKASNKGRLLWKSMAFPRKVSANDGCFHDEKGWMGI